MMMHSMNQFSVHSSLALQFIALAAGLFLINKAHGEDFFCKKTGKIIGGFIVIATLLSIVCTLYLSLKSCCHESKSPDMKGWQHPSFDMPMSNNPAGSDQQGQEK